MKKPSPQDISAPGYALAGRLNPYVRRAREEWRGPWLIPHRRILDYLLVYITRGSGRFDIDGHAFEGDEGDLIWIPPNTLHEMEGYAPKMLVAYIHFDLLYDPRRSPGTPITPGGTRSLAALRKFLHPPLKVPLIDGWCGKLAVANGPYIYALMKKIQLENASTRDGLALSGLMLQLIAEIARGLSPAAALANIHWPAMQRSLGEIAAQAGGPLDVIRLAAGARLSVSHFRKLFQAVHGQSPRTVHNAARIQKACEMMLYSGERWTLTQIADRLGFSTVHNFSRAFRRTLGVSPRQYRRERMRQASS
jgi:AraC-like DNA-binding protein